MANKKVLVNVEAYTVEISHTTAHAGGTIDAKTTFDFSNCDEKDILLWAAQNRLIATRVATGVKNLTKDAALEAFDGVTIDCSKSVAKVVDVKVNEMLELAKASGLTLDQLKDMIVAQAKMNLAETAE